VRHSLFASISFRCPLAEQLGDWRDFARDAGDRFAGATGTSLTASRLQIAQSTV